MSSAGSVTHAATHGRTHGRTQLCAGCLAPPSYSSALTFAGKLRPRHPPARTRADSETGASRSRASRRRCRRCQKRMARQEQEVGERVGCP